MHPMTPTDKMLAFAEHCGTIDPSFTPFSNQSRHPLDDIFDMLEVQIGLNKALRSTVKPFASMQNLKGRLRNPNDPRLTRFEPCLRNLCSCWGTASNYPDWNNPRYLLNQVRSKLDACRDFVCSDATTFEGCANKRTKDAILDRCRQGQIATGRPQIPTDGMAFLRGNLGSGWDPDHLKATYDKVYNARAGECTSFGYSAAHLLHDANQKNKSGLRIEVVVWKKTSLIKQTESVRNEHYDATKPVGPNNKYRIKTTKMERKKTWGGLLTKQVPVMTHSTTTHVYCVVNRSGGTKDVEIGKRSTDATSTMRKMPPVETWGNDCFIVDTWLASLGWGSVFLPQSYPIKSMLKDLYQEMDNRSALRLDRV